MRSVLLALSVLMGVAITAPAGVLVEAEGFDNKGGWSVDQQFTHIMGSSYLLAHGMGTPVKNAETTAKIPEAGAHHVWVRTKDWVPGPWEAPGRFRVLVNGKALEPTFGTEESWGWQPGGTVQLKAGDIKIALEDLTGFDGRCDAIYFDTNADAKLPNDLESMRPWRDKLLGLPSTPKAAENFDVVIVGGGIAGCGAALAANQQGLNVAIIQDRPVFGGNASGEIRVHTIGITGLANDILEDINTPHYPNGDEQAMMIDLHRELVMEAAENVTAFLNWRAYDAHTVDGRIVSVDARHTHTNEIKRFFAPVFIDATGDGWVGYWAGADYRYGRESREEFDEGRPEIGELWSPKAPDNWVMGATLLWNSHTPGGRVDFPETPWAMPVAKDHIALNGEWYWEYTDNDLNQIYDAEQIRDHLLRAIYGSFGNAKKNPENDRIGLKWVAYVVGKRESRRLMGDYIYTMHDIFEGTEFPDAVVMETRFLDLHNQRHLEGAKVDFLSVVTGDNKKRMKNPRYYIPFRSLYSRNIGNLMMAGRCFSTSHVGLGGPRVMNTTGQMGVATGFAASLCKKYDTNPRGVYKNHIEELRKLCGYE